MIYHVVWKQVNHGMSYNYDAQYMKKHGLPCNVMVYHVIPQNTMVYQTTEWSLNKKIIVILWYIFIVV